jgi:hypothetical protein
MERQNMKGLKAKDRERERQREQCERARGRVGQRRLAEKNEC